MREAVVVASSRTGLAKSYRGSFNMTRPEDLAAHCLSDVLRRIPLLDVEEVEDVILGCAQPWGPQGGNIARKAVLLAGMPVSVPAVTVNRFCSSGLQAIAMAAHSIVNEGAEAAIGGGVESFSLTQRIVDAHPQLARDMPGLYMELGTTAELLAHEYRISRGAQDEYALISQQRTARAQEEGFFDEEIAPMYVSMALIDRNTGETMGTAETCCDKDECNRPETDLETLLTLRPVFDQESGRGSVTAGNSSQLADGASATLLMSRERADQLGIPYKLIFRAFLVTGCEPEEMGLAPVYAVSKLLKRYGLSIDDIDLWELDEAFAVQVVYCRDQLAIPMDKLNVNGGAISMGHPFGMTGSRLTGTLANEMARRPGSRFGVVTMSVGGGQGAAGLFEAVH
jgi:acetyl-CoA acetyltransferase family protein